MFCKIYVREIKSSKNTNTVVYNFYTSQLEPIQPETNIIMIQTLLIN